MRQVFVAQRHRLQIGLFVMAVLVAGAGSAAVDPGDAHPTGPNLLTNPGFDGDVSSWLGPATWDSRHDAGGNRDSGSLRLSRPRTSSNSCATEEQCLAVNPGTYELSGKALVLAGDSNGSASLRLHFCATTDCMCSPLSFGGSLGLVRGRQDAWLPLTTGPLVAPAGTQSAGILLLACPEKDLVEADFDDMVFRRVPTATNPPK
ncbi:MAG TPA: hypothetical protein VFE33_12955 [Thermoanaerobaculia bacterium]|nr:hypothetical protein [Thermoanaerobaculia bacterium]